MNKVALLAAIVFTLVSGRSAEASSSDSYYFDYNQTFSLYGGDIITGADHFVTSNDQVVSASGSVFDVSGSGSVNGGSITGIYSPSFYNSPTSLDLDFALSTGGHVFFISGGAPYAPGANVQAVFFLSCNGNPICSGDAASTYGTLSVSPVPLPASAPLFGLTLLGLATFRFASKRLKRDRCGPVIIVG
jgi:hypothetical protein